MSLGGFENMVDAPSVAPILPHVVDDAAMDLASLPPESERVGNRRQRRQQQREYDDADADLRTPAGKRQRLRVMTHLGQPDDEDEVEL